jgi:hypothetical protein
MKSTKNTLCIELVVIHIFLKLMFFYILNIESYKRDVITARIFLHINTIITE